MTQAWFLLIIAGVLEVAWAIGLKYGEGFFNFRNKPVICTLTLLGLLASMYLLSLAMRSIPVGTAYAIWTGIGALGAATLGIILFHEPANAARIACLLMLVAGIVGLKLTTPISQGAEPLNQTDELFIGGYGKGVLRTALDLNSGELATPTLIADLPSASFLARHPTLPILYTVSEVESGAVIALRREGDGSYIVISRHSSGGNGPCHLSVHPNGRAVFVANYGDGQVAMLPLNEDGTFRDRSATDQHKGSGPHPKRQTHAYAHSFYPHPDGTHALSADLGCDAIFIYQLDFDRGELAEKKQFDLPPGSGPRHLAFSADGRVVYVVNELSNTVMVLQWTDASLSLVQTISTLPEGYDQPSTCAEIRIHPSGRFLYASNRGHDSIATFSIDPQVGKLTARGYVASGGASPRGFEVDPSGRFLIVANQKSNVLTVFRIDRESGLPSATGTTMTAEKPACVRFAGSQP